MTSSRREAACSAISQPEPDTSPVTAGDGARPDGTHPGGKWAAPLAGAFLKALDGFTEDADGPGAGTRCEPLTERAAEEQVHGICFKTGPPGRIGVELEWLVYDGRDPGSPVDQQRVATALAGIGSPGALPGCGRLTTEPGGQIELSSAPAVGLAACISTAFHDLAAIRQAVRPAGLCLAGQGLDPLRSPRRVLDLPRYAAMEEFFNRDGPWGQLMMCSTASVQVCLDAGEEGNGLTSFDWRWRLLYAIGPVLVAAFANSPLQRGRPTGWKSTRQRIWSRLDPGRTRAPAHAEPPTAGARPNGHADHRAAWVQYVLGAEVMCVRRSGTETWSAPAGLTFRDWLRGAGERPPTLGDLTYHLSTLFPPVRPQGHLEVRVIDAQPGDDWVVPAAVVTALLDDPIAGQEAMAAAETLWAAPDPWLRAARLGPADPVVAAASRRCFAAAQAALPRLGAPAHVREAVAAFTERYVLRDRCPADDRLEEAGEPAPGAPAATPLEEQP
jgi:glutamate--cysteine ligase